MQFIKKTTDLLSEMSINRDVKLYSISKSGTDGQNGHKDRFGNQQKCKDHEKATYNKKQNKKQNLNRTDGFFRS